jgi:phage anti-repressor protein
MSLVPQNPESTFVTPHYLQELGEEGLTLHEVAASLGIEFKEAKRALEKNISDYTAVEFATSVASGPIRGNVEVTSYALSTDDAKFFVASYRNEVGKAYLRFLIQCEKALMQRDRSPYVPVAPALRDALEAYSLLGAPLHLVQIEAVKRVKQQTGQDLTSGLAIAPAQQRIPDEDIFLAPTELAPHLGLQSAIAVNRALERAGLQVRRNGEWFPTEEASGLFFRQSWTRGSKSGYNLRWRLSAITKALKS